MKLITTAAYAASQSLAQQGLRVQRSHLSEITTALLGYGTFAALKSEEANPALNYHLSDAERLVLNEDLAQVRANALGLPNAVIAACIAALQTRAGIPVHVGVQNLYDEYAREILEQAIADGESTAMAMADSNASFPDAPDLEEKPTVNGNLWTSPTEWSLEASGTMSGEYDLDGDRMYNGHELNVWGKLIFAKAGRAGLLFLDGEEGAEANDAWRDEEFY